MFSQICESNHSPRCYKQDNRWNLSSTQLADLRPCLLLSLVNKMSFLYLDIQKKTSVEQGAWHEWPKLDSSPQDLNSTHSVCVIFLIEWYLIHVNFVVRKSYVCMTRLQVNLSWQLFSWEIHDCGYIICDVIPEGNGCDSCVVCLELCAVICSLLLM